jgi:membrane protease YdiL (CAAX protease family)
MLAEQSLKLLITLIVVGFLLCLKKKRAKFFLIPGDIAAPAEPVSWLGIKPGETWKKVGSRFALFLSLGTLAFLVIAGRPPLDIVIKAVPFLPAVFLCAALNAFHEEMTYKASFLAVLGDVVGGRQALWLMAAYFGILHYYGIPYGMIGVLMATFLGWFLGKSMLETRGLWWAWFIHFVQDVLIFAFLAIGSIRAGG